MFKPLVLFIGLRYLRAQRRTQFISFISLASVLGMALGVTALITVLSVMNGFEAELRASMLGITSHITFTGEDDQLSDWQTLDSQIQHYPHILGSAPYVTGQVMLNADRRVSPTQLRGVDPSLEARVSEVTDKMIAGDIHVLAPGKFNIVLGVEIANFLGVIVGDRITVISPQVSSSTSGVTPKMHSFTVAGVFKAGNEYDRKLALVNIEDGAQLFHLEHAVSGIRLKLDDLFNAPALAEQMRQEFKAPYHVSDWTEENGSHFHAVKIEKRVMSIILLLIVAVAAFNIVATLVMVVTDKRGDIAILKTQGLSANQVMGVFVVLGSVIGLIGTALGTLGGVLLALNIETIVPAIEGFLHMQILAADVFYNSAIPSQLIWSDVVAIAGMSFLLSIVATVYPAWQASQINPAEVLRYE